MIFLQGTTPIEAPPADKVSFLVWAIGVLILVVITIFTLWNKAQVKVVESYKERISEKNTELAGLRLELKTEQQENIKMMAQILPALESINLVLKELVDKYK